MPKPSLTVTGTCKKIIFYLALIALWEMVFRTGLWPEYLLPSPLGVLNNLAAGFRDTTYLIAISASLKRVAVGYTVSLVLGLVLGLLIIRIGYLDETMRPLLLGFQTLPSICWLPMAVLWFGIGEGSIIFVIAVGSVFSIASAVVSGVKNIPPIYMRAARTMGARGLKAYTTVVLPASLPAVIAGMKQGWSFAWRALMAGELLSPKDGLGYAMLIGRDLHDMSQVVGVMIIIVIIGLVIDKLVFGKLEESVRYRRGLAGA